MSYYPLTQRSTSHTRDHSLRHRVWRLLLGLTSSILSTCPINRFGMTLVSVCHVVSCYVCDLICILPKRFPNFFHYKKIDYATFYISVFIYIRQISLYTFPLIIFCLPGWGFDSDMPTHILERYHEFIVYYRLVIMTM